MPKELSEELDTFHLHEALDRSFICMEMVERLILEHPYIQANEILKAKAEEAHQLLFEIYQCIGSLSIKESV